MNKNSINKSIDISNQRSESAMYSVNFMLILES